MMDAWGVHAAMIDLCRLWHVAMQRDYWRNCRELYAWEAGWFPQAQKKAP